MYVRMYVYIMYVCMYVCMYECMYVMEYMFVCIENMSVINNNSMACIFAGLPVSFS